MDSVEITSVIIDKLEKVLDLGFNRLYVNVDDLENGCGFLRILAMQESEYIIVYEGTFSWDVCRRVLEMLEKSQYDITDFTTKMADD